MTRIPKNNVRSMVIKQNLYNWIRITLVCLQKLELSCGSISLLVLTMISRKEERVRLPLWLDSFQQLFTCTVQKMFLKKIKKEAK